MLWLERYHRARLGICRPEHRAEAVGQIRDARVLRQILTGTLARVLDRNASGAAGEPPGERYVEVGRAAGVREYVEPGLSHRLDRDQSGAPLNPLSLLVRNNLSDLRSNRRVSWGWITASMNPRSAAMYGIAMLRL